MPTKREAMTAKAKSLVGCGYVYGATGWICTRRRLDQQARQYPQYADLIYRYGPRWFGRPCYDCAQLTRTVAKAAGVPLPSGSSSQWNAASVWKEKGTIDTLPDEAGLFVFTLNAGRATHTAVTIGNGQAVDARGHALGVVQRALSGASYTHWARLNVDYEAPAQGESEENPGGGETRRTLRAGMSGEDVQDVQRTLLSLGYDLGASGMDGRFGSATRAAVTAFQRANGLAADGVVGPATWQMLDAAQPAGAQELCLTGVVFDAFAKAMARAKPDGGDVLVPLDRELYVRLMAELQRE